MTQQIEEKEWKYIDFTNTSAYLTVKAFNKEGIHWKMGEGPEGKPGIPDKEFVILKRLRKLDSTIKPDKGPITKEIKSMHRRIVRQQDGSGKEYLTVQGYFLGYDFAGVQIGQEFSEYVNKKPILGKVYDSDRMRFHPESGIDLGKTVVIKSIDEYTLEVPKDVKSRTKLIAGIIEKANGTFKDTIKYYYHDADTGFRDSTFSYGEFTELAIEDLRELSKRGGGAKGSGYYRDADNKLHKSDGTLVAFGQ